MVEYVGTRHSRARTRRAARAETPLLRRLDWTLVATVAAIVAYGLWAIGGITRHDVPGNPSYFLIRQGIYAALGCVAALLASRVRYDTWRRLWPALALVTFVLLAAVFKFQGGKNPVYFVYGYKRGAYWPFVPTGEKQERDNAEELELKAKLEKELPIEPDLSRWFGLFNAPL